ncbi:MAG: hypothetical protein A3A97_00775 [Candidatus Terrybacteria bacterium RIFCSPLOWO2_01_FULL_40_23]|uniref:ABC transmembrane type-1 domain-containing protein n=1 Tax=Candidatus Terrybacteria bacterium RIFCSPLOWO2_01_FULL_40_23 TaxID=1802366 RepID=A0A1G2PUX2_9BACT|nr:MAG: hypothetical protein A3A97_00775 [Candidatus Terrybacteria bacterium RIFCSPLOWO2_01_FULL_40_23]
MGTHNVEDYIAKRLKESGDEEYFDTRQERSRLFKIKRWCLRHRIATVALFILTVLYFFGIFASVIAPYDPLAQDLTNVNKLPSAEHIFGTDRLGRDMFSRTLFALRNDIGITIATFFTGAGMLAVFLGMLAGYKGGKTDMIINRIGEITAMLPGLLFMILISATIRPQYESAMDELINSPSVVWASSGGLSIFLAIFAIALCLLFVARRLERGKLMALAAFVAVSMLILSVLAWLVTVQGFVDFLLIFIVLIPFSWYGTARIIRSQTLSLKNADFIEAARAVGATDFRIIIRHIFPNILYLVVVGMSAGLGGIVFSEIALTYLGLGIQPPTPSFGAMLYDAGSIRSLQVTPHLMLIPSMVIMLFVFCWNLIGDALSSDLTLKNRS